MSVITREVLQGLETNINVTWQKRFENAPTADLWKQIAMPINSKNASEKYAFLGAVRGLREFKDERIPGTLSGFSYSIDNKKWESTLDVDRDLIEDDRTGEIMMAVTSLATKAAKHYTKLITTAFTTGAATAIYDTKNFFATDHPLGSNYLGTSKSLDATNVLAAEKLLNKQVDDRGDFLGYMGTHIICGPELAADAEKLVNQAFLAGGESNFMYHRYQVIVLPDMGTNKTWAVADLSEGLLPFIMQIRVPLTLVSKNELNSDRAFDKDVYTWGTRGRHQAGYGNHQLIVAAVSA